MMKERDLNTEEITGGLVLAKGIETLHYTHFIKFGGPSFTLNCENRVNFQNKSHYLFHHKFMYMLIFSDQHNFFFFLCYDGP